MALKIKSVDLDRILQHAMECFPIEACGILVGKRVNNEVVVERVYRTRNVLNSSYAYQIDSEEQLKIFKLSEDEGLEVIASITATPTMSHSGQKWMKRKASFGLATPSS